MKTTIKNISTNKGDAISDGNIIQVYNEKADSHDLLLSKEELKYVKKQIKDDKAIVSINQLNRFVHFVNIKGETDINKYAENCRMLGDKLHALVKDTKNIHLLFDKTYTEEGLLIAEGLALTNYTFTKHKTDPKPNKLENIYLSNHDEIKEDVAELENTVAAVYLTRNLINEPFSHLTAKELAESAVQSGKENGMKITVFNKKKIEALKMGGLLAVNKGSIDEPTFTIIEWNPKNATNKQPIVLVGKGIVYDTGGLSLKPTANSMDLMKIDMGGAGTVLGAMQAIAANKLNKHVIALLPATDNRPSGNAYAPGDVITMHDGTTVEVLNTDAEGRLVLADALSFAKKYKPSLVIDLATLTGAAVAAIGHYGFVSMHENAEQEHAALKKMGDQVHERLAEFPFWSDYDELIKSDIADIKNLGGPYGGAITAGKFLAHFADYPFIHIDLPGVYSKAKYGYRGKGATGMGVRLLYNFIKNN
ncbi:MAG: leucyl aminopeptidase [Flavobacteriales bacterium]|jgi:leucyl aminopeptidase|nr:leucyl aminopeptidase [Flavobacteriales bacterium]MBT5750775.1 leucyl aminopeptidase [Flavobacteriales bacterium]